MGKCVVSRNCKFVKSDLRQVNKQLIFNNTWCMLHDIRPQVSLTARNSWTETCSTTEMQNTFLTIKIEKDPLVRTVLWQEFPSCKCALRGSAVLHHQRWCPHTAASHSAAPEQPLASQPAVRCRSLALPPPAEVELSATPLRSPLYPPAPQPRLSAQ